MDMVYPSLSSVHFFFFPENAAHLGSRTWLTISLKCAKRFFFFIFFLLKMQTWIVGYGLSIYLRCALQTQNPKFENQIIENTSQI